MKRYFDTLTPFPKPVKDLPTLEQRVEDLENICREAAAWRARHEIGMTLLKKHVAALQLEDC